MLAFLIMELTKFQQDCGLSEEDFLLYLENKVPQYRGKGRSFIEKKLSKALVKTWEAEYMKEKVAAKLKEVTEYIDSWLYDLAVIRYRGAFNQWSVKTFKGNVYQAYIVEEEGDFVDVCLVNENNSPAFFEEVEHLFNDKGNEKEPRPMGMWLTEKI